ncbi:MAG: cupredoxin domain-containing protein [Acidimicrobiia bacterium]|jgi:plastocyanin
MRKTTVLVGVLALVVAACGGGGDTIADGGEVTIVMTEYQFEPSEIHLAVGTTVTFVLTNEGEKDHELMAGDEVHVEDGTPHGFETDFFDTVADLTIDPPDALETEMEGMDMGDESMDDESMDDESMDEEMSDTTMGDMEDDDEHMDMDVMVVREPAQTARITFTVTEDSIGEWEFGCFEEDGAHWDDGMRGTIIVEEA